MASLDLAHTDLDAILASLPAGTSYVGTVTAVSGQTSTTVAALAGFGTNYFKTGWTMVVLWDNGGGNVPPEGEVVDITAYTSVGGVFTHGSTTQIAIDDVIMVKELECEG